jgi:diamine N-acetyltransferase
MLTNFRIRPLERKDLRFIHELNNNETIIHYWFEEPYEAFVELCQLYDKHIHNQNERRFIAESNREMLGLVEIVEIDYIHRRAQFQIIIAPNHQRKGYATEATRLAMNYAFNVLNLHKLYLIVDCQNEPAIKIYTKLGFREEGVLKDEFFVNGQYRDVYRMAVRKSEFDEKSINFNRQH